MVSIEPIRVEIDREDDGRILASVPDLPGVMAYGNTEVEAVRKVKTIALQVLADMIESGEEVPEPLRVLFAARALGARPRQNASMPPCYGWAGRSRNTSDHTGSFKGRAGRISPSVFTTAKKWDRLRLPKSAKKPA